MPSTDDERTRTSPVEDAVRKLETVSRLRELARHPAAVALAVQRVTTAINWLIWTGILLGIAFSTANVQRFAAAGAHAFTTQWWAAWLFEPFINLVLIAILLGQQVAARYHIVIDATWPTTTKWVCFTATFSMNTWTYWSPFDLAGVLLHAIPPGIVLCAVETAPVLNAALARAVDAAERAAQDQTEHHPVSISDNPATPHTTDDTADAQPADQQMHKTTTSSNPAGRPGPRRRRTRQEIIDAALRAWRPGTIVDRQWVLQVSGCSAGIATEVAEAVRAALRDRPHQPDTDTPSAAEHAAIQPAPVRG